MAQTSRSDSWGSDGGRRNVGYATLFRVMSNGLSLHLSLLSFVSAELFQTGCGARTSLDEEVIVAASGGQSSIGGASGMNTAGNTGESTGTGGTVSSGETSTFTSTGCHGQAVARPTMSSNGQSGHCGTFTQSMVIGGVQVNIMEAFLTGSETSTPGGPPCYYPTPANIPLNVASTGLGYRDPNNLSVWFELPSGDAEMFPNVQFVNDCTDAGAWYLDDNSSPTQINLCPCTCERVNSTPGTMFVVDFPVICPFL